MGPSFKLGELCESLRGALFLASAMKLVIKRRLEEGDETRVSSIRSNSTMLYKLRLRGENLEEEEVEARRDLKKLINITDMQRQQQHQHQARLPVIIRRGKRELFRHNQGKDVKFFGRKLRYQTRLGTKQNCGQIDVTTATTTKAAKMSLMFVSLAFFALILHVNVKLGGGK